MCRTGMTDLPRLIGRAGRAARAARAGSIAVASLVSFMTAGVVRAQESGSQPSGWVGLSVIQSSSGENGGAVTVGYPVVASVDPGSPAQAAGLIAGDTILAYNDIDAKSDPRAVRRFLKAGQRLVIKVRRNTVRNLTLTVARRTAQNTYTEGMVVSSASGATFPVMYGGGNSPVTIAASVSAGRGVAPFAGAYLARLNAKLAEALNVGDSGVLVLDLGNGSAAARSGLEAGDVITRADSLAVLSPLEIMTALNLASQRSITLSVSRRGKVQNITVRW